MKNRQEGVIIGHLQTIGDKGTFRVFVDIPRSRAPLEVSTRPLPGPCTPLPSDKGKTWKNMPWFAGTHQPHLPPHKPCPLRKMLFCMALKASLVFSTTKPVRARVCERLRLGCWAPSLVKKRSSSLLHGASLF